MKSRLHIVIGGDEEINRKVVEILREHRIFREVDGPAGKHRQLVGVLSIYDVPVMPNLINRIGQITNPTTKRRTLVNLLNDYLFNTCHRQTERSECESIILFVGEGNWLITEDPRIEIEDCVLLSDSDTFIHEFPTSGIPDVDVMNFERVCYQRIAEATFARLSGDYGGIVIRFSSFEAKYDSADKRIAEYVKTYVLGGVEATRKLLTLSKS